MEGALINAMGNFNLDPRWIKFCIPIHYWNFRDNYKKIYNFLNIYYHLKDLKTDLKNVKSKTFSSIQIEKILVTEKKEEEEESK